MASAKFLEGIAALKGSGASRAAAQYLERAGDDLERLAKKSIDGKGALGTDDARLFNQLYTEYAQVAIRDRRAQKAGGSSVDDIRLNAEIRDDFFNKVLGHVGKTDAERDMLRTALLRRSGTAAENGKVALLNGKGTVAFDEYNAMRLVPKEQAKFLNGAERTTWDIVQANETALATRSRADRLRDAEVVAPRQVARDDRQVRAAADAAERQKQAAADAVEKQKQADAQAAKAKADAERAVQVAATRSEKLTAIEVAAKADLKAVKTAFGQFDEHVRQSEKGLIHGGARNGGDLTDAHAVFDELKQGKTVTTGEYQLLRSQMIGDVAREQATKASTSLHTLASGKTRSFKPAQEIQDDLTKLEDALKVQGKLTTGVRSVDAKGKEISIAAAVQRTIEGRGITSGDFDALKNHVINFHSFEARQGMPMGGMQPNQQLPMPGRLVGGAVEGAKHIANSVNKGKDKVAHAREYYGDDYSSVRNTYETFWQRHGVAVGVSTAALTGALSLGGWMFGSDNSGDFDDNLNVGQRIIYNVGRVQSEFDKKFIPDLLSKDEKSLSPANQALFRWAKANQQGVDRSAIDARKQALEDEQNCMDTNADRVAQGLSRVDCSVKGSSAGGAAPTSSSAASKAPPSISAQDLAAKTKELGDLIDLDEMQKGRLGAAVSKVDANKNGKVDTWDEIQALKREIEGTFTTGPARAMALNVFKLPDRAP